MVVYVTLTGQMPKRVVIVDGDPLHIASFSQNLIRLCPDWELTFFSNSTDSLKHLEANSCDVFISDMTMPDSTGPQLLNEVGRLYPTVVRFVMAEALDKEAVMKCVLGSNHFLPKPCEPEAVRKAVDRALTLEKWLSNDEIKSLVLRIRTFPSIPSLYFEVLKELRSPDASAQRVGEIISQDLAMSTKVLQVLNSAYYAIARQITDPAEAVTILGFEMVKSLVLCIQVFSQFDKVKPYYFSIDKLWRHSTAVAQAARHIARFEGLGAEAADEIYTAGLLHDIGKLVLVSNFSDEYQAVQTRVRNEHISLWDAEREAFGASHAEIGAYLIGLWGMPLPLAEAACFHHKPRLLTVTAPITVAVVHAANVIVSEGQSDGTFIPEIDEEFLARVNLKGRSKDWREMLASEAPESLRTRSGHTQSWVRAKPPEPEPEPVRAPEPETSDLPRWVLTLAISGAIFLWGLAALRMFGLL